MPRPLHAIMICNPTKIQINFAPPVGADRCVGPLRTRHTPSENCIKKGAAAF